MPVTVSFREDETKPWTLITRSKDSIGKHSWELPFLNTRKLAVRVTVEDIGKNVTECIVDRLVVDSKEVTLNIVDVTPAGGDVASGGAQPAGAQQDGSSAPRAKLVDEKAARAHFEKGRVLRAQQKWADAAREFELAVDNMPDFRDALNDLGCVLYRGEKYKEAATAFGKAVELTPQDPELCYNFAAALFGTREYEKAVDRLLPLLDDSAAAEKVGPRAADLLWSISLEFSKAGNPRTRGIWQRLSEISIFSSQVIRKAKDALAR